MKTLISTIVYKKINQAIVGSTL